MNKGLKIIIIFLLVATGSIFSLKAQEQKPKAKEEKSKQEAPKPVKIQEKSDKSPESKAKAPEPRQGSATQGQGSAPAGSTRQGKAGNQTGSKDKINYKAAGTLKSGVINGERYQQLVNNVEFQQKTTIIKCDSAMLFRERNALEAFGNVRIYEGDSITITGKTLFYDGDLKIATMHDKVVYKDPSMTLYTDHLVYNMPYNLATYYDGGKIVDTVNIVTSIKGYYDNLLKFASFKTDVVVTNPDYIIESDTLQYNFFNKVVYFRDQTKVTTPDGTIAHYKKGEYNTVYEQTALLSGIIETETYTIEGNQLYFDDQRKYYEANDDVVLVSKKDNIIITGDHARHWAVDTAQHRKISIVYGRALMKKPLENDTLFVSADTLMTIEDTAAAEQRILAWKNVKIFKLDVQGKSDSLAYFNADSILKMYQNPILWNNEESQMTGDTIDMIMVNQQIDELILRTNAFVISLDTLRNFNQMKGRKITSYFQDQQMHKVVVDGNGESIYFALEEKDTIILMTGMNNIVCSNILINFQDQKIKNLTFYVKPDASFVPPHEFTEENIRLKGFDWKIDYRPDKEEVVKHLDKRKLKRKEGDEEGGGDKEGEKEEDSKKPRVVRKS